MIVQTICQKLLDGFQGSKFLFGKSFLEAVAHRRDLKSYLIRAFDFLYARAVAGCVKTLLRRIRRVLPYNCKRALD